MAPVDRPVEHRHDDPRIAQGLGPERAQAGDRSSASLRVISRRSRVLGHDRLAPRGGVYL